MTTYTTYTKDGKQVEVRSNPGAAPMVYVNGVIQDPGTYRITPGLNVLFNHTPNYIWEPTRIWLPKKINNRWYRPGSIVYRREGKGPTEGGYWIYGDEFDILKKL
jgi:hypothetical protein